MVPTPRITSRPLLAQITAEQQRAVVARIVGRKPAAAPVDVAAFSSSI